MNTVSYDKLPVAFKKEWVKALRSGKFKQSRCELREKTILIAA